MLFQESLQRRADLFCTSIGGKIHAAALVFTNALVKHASVEVFAEECHSQMVQSSADRDDLLHDVAARAIVIHHPLNAGNLPGDARQAALRIDLEFSGHGLVYDDAAFRGSMRVICFSFKLP